MSLQRIEPYRRSERCVTCGYPRSSHHPETQQCPELCHAVLHPHTREWKASTFGTMNLPEGATCADCVHLRHPCATIYGRIATDERCDWYPSRFNLKRTLSGTDNRDSADSKNEGKGE